MRRSAGTDLVLILDYLLEPRLWRRLAHRLEHHLLGLPRRRLPPARLLPLHSALTNLALQQARRVRTRRIRARCLPRQAGALRPQQRLHGLGQPEVIAVAHSNVFKLCQKTYDGEE